MTCGGPAEAASAAGVGAWKSARTGTEIPCSLSRPVSAIASSECPPSAMKSSSGPTWSRPRTSANARQMISSRTVTGPRPVEPGGSAACGAGSACLSTLPLAVTGSASSTTTAEGTMYSGSWPAACSRTAAARPVPS